MTTQEAKKIIRDYYNAVFMKISLLEEAKKVAADNGCLMKQEYLIEWANDNKDTEEE